MIKEIIAGVTAYIVLAVGFVCAFVVLGFVAHVLAICVLWGWNVAF